MKHQARMKNLLFAAVAVALMALSPLTSPAQTPTPARPSVYQTTLEEPNQKTPEITTEELQKILATNSEPVFDVRTAKEYAIAHIPGTVNVYEKEVERITQLYPDRAQQMILYCNGPSCGKSKRTSEQLVALGYTNVRRYQLGMPVWRALSQTVQTDMPGFDYIFKGDHTAVFVDARTPSEFGSETVPHAVNVQAGEATVANDDGRLPFTDKGTRIVVFGTSAQQARTVSGEIAKKAYWNSSYFGGMFMDLQTAGYINHPPIARAKSITVAADDACSASVSAADVDDGSFDPDTGDTVTLSLDPSGTFGVGQHAVTLTAVDSHGLKSSSAAVVTVVDAMAPAIVGATADKAVLSPPNHRMEAVAVNYDATDNCGAVNTALSITSSEPINGTGDGDTSPDWEVVDAHHVRLRAERSGDGSGRVYTITITATDSYGNSANKQVRVMVLR